MPTDARPDVATLRVIQEEELKKEGVIGAGAFGTVHKVGGLEGGGGWKEEVGGEGRWVERGGGWRGEVGGEGRWVGGKERWGEGKVGRKGESGRRLKD